MRVLIIGFEQPQDSCTNGTEHPLKVLAQRMSEVDCIDAEAEISVMTKQEQFGETATPMVKSEVGKASASAIILLTCNSSSSKLKVHCMDRGESSMKLTNGMVKVIGNATRINVDERANEIAFIRKLKMKQRSFPVIWISIPHQMDPEQGEQGILAAIRLVSTYHALTLSKAGFGRTVDVDKSEGSLRSLGETESSYKSETSIFSGGDAEPIGEGDESTCGRLTESEDDEHIVTKPTRSARRMSMSVSEMIEDFSENFNETFQGGLSSPQKKISAKQGRYADRLKASHTSISTTLKNISTRLQPLDDDGAAETSADSKRTSFARNRLNGTNVSRWEQSLEDEITASTDEPTFSTNRRESAVLDTIKTFNEKAGKNADFSSTRKFRNSIVDLVAREDYTPSFSNFSTKSTIFESVGSLDEADNNKQSSLRTVTKTNKEAEAKEDPVSSLPEPETALTKLIRPQTQKIRTPLKIIAGIPLPGDSLKVEPLGSLKINFNDVYKLGDIINSGAFGTVYRAYHVSSGSNAQIAVKIIDRISEAADGDVIKETQILKDIRKIPNVVRLFDFYMDEYKLYIIQELAAGGDVFDRLVERQTYTESDARDLSKLLLDTMRILHEKKIVHRDLKPENLLLKNTKSDSCILVCDFGYAKYLPSDGSGLWTNAGTPTFTAPEIVNGVTYKQEVDMWSIGCIIFMLLGGYQPFDAETDFEVYDYIARADYGFDDPIWEVVSEKAKSLISNLLILDRNKRLSASDALDTRWVLTCPTSELQKNDLKKSTEGMKYYNENVRKKDSYIDEEFVGDEDYKYFDPWKYVNEEAAKRNWLRPQGHHLVDQHH